MRIVTVLWFFIAIFMMILAGGATTLAVFGYIKSFEQLEYLSLGVGMTSFAGYLISFALLAMIYPLTNTG